MEVEDHSVRRGTLLMQGCPFDGDKKFVGMAVDVVALALVVGQGMGHLEAELLGESQKHDGRLWVYFIPTG